MRGGGVVTYRPLPHNFINICTDTLKITEYFIVGNPNNSNLFFSQIFCSILVYFFLLLLVMLRTVQFNDKTRFCTIKVCDIFAQNFLSIKTNRILAQKIIPEVSLLFGHFLSESSSERDKCFVFLSIH